MSNGLTLDLLPMDKFIKLNNLQEVTNPIYLIKQTPTPDGVLSYEIFGTTQDDRRNRMAYIDLHGHYMCPIAAKKLKAYDRRLDNILYSVKKYRLDGDDLVEDQENGNTGPEFLYSIWGKVKVKDKETVTTKEVEKFFRQDKSVLFWTKFPVIPAFYRDINKEIGASSGKSTKMSTAQLNSTYSSIISYTQSMVRFTDTFTMMRFVTQSRVQKLMVDIYDALLLNTVKGSQSKYGMLHRFMLSKSVDYSARLVITAPILNTDTYEDMQVRYGYAVIPLPYILTIFFPFIVYHMKRYYDSLFLESGARIVANSKTGEHVKITFTESFDENYITSLITKYVNSPSTRFELAETPPDADGKKYAIVLSGRYLRNNTTFNRAATVTDILYVVACRAVADKHVFVTRYPLDNYNGQFPARITVASTIKTQPTIIGENNYKFFPVCEGDPTNAFVETAKYSNTNLESMGADYDGDQVSIRPVFSIEANRDIEERMKSPAYLLDVNGEAMRSMSKDFILTAYNLTATKSILQDANKEKPLYVI